MSNGRLRAALVCALTLLALVSLEPWLLVVRAAVAVTRVTSCSGDDATCTFGAAPAAGAPVVIFSTLGTEAETLDITGFHGEVETVLGASPYDAGTPDLRAYAFCAYGDGSDTTFVATTSGTGGAATAALELTGSASCAGIFREAQSNDDTDDSNFALTTDLTVLAGDLVVGCVRSESAANFTAAGSPTATIAAGDAEIGANTLCQYVTIGANGVRDTTYTAAATESAFIWAMTLRVASNSGLTLLGVGP